MGRTLLVVDDQATIRNILVQILKLEGYEVLSAAHGLEALQRAAEHPGPIDVLITDLMMPFMGGEELIERLAEERPETRVICLSAAFSKASLSRDILYLPKPFSIRSVVHTVKSVLDGSPPKEAMTG